MERDASRDEILAYLDEYLRVSDFRDYGPQGLQVEGRERVAHVVSGVSACAALFEAAAAAGADLVIAHHGILWDFESRVVRGPFRRRLELLLRHGITLAGYHLCLDAHPDLGNNVLGSRGLGLEELQPWCEHGGQALGFHGVWPEGRSPEAALAAVDALYGSRSLAFLTGPALVSRVGVVSGGAQKEIRAALDLGLDMFVTGEASEFVMHTAAEGGIHFIAAGHHNTERLGIRALGEHLAARFGIRHTFIDLPNPV